MFAKPSQGIKFTHKKHTHTHTLGPLFVHCNFQKIFLLPLMIYSHTKLFSVEKKLFCSILRRISFDKKDINLERIKFVLEEINFGKNLLCTGI